LLALLAGELKTLPNALLIEGHTDATPYSTDAGYSNWELSADRANSARRLLQQTGVRSDQVTQVRGYADQMLRVKNNPQTPPTAESPSWSKTASHHCDACFRSPPFPGAATDSSQTQVPGPLPGSKSSCSDNEEHSPMRHGFYGQDHTACSVF
jgi:hypothetical protein